MAQDHILLSDFDYHLPPERIAQQPAAKRDRSRLMVMSREDGALRHHRFHELPDMLSPSDLMVINNTKVLPVRLEGSKASGGKAEILILDYGRRPPSAAGGPQVYQCLVRAAKRPKAGTRLRFAQDLNARVVETLDTTHMIEFDYDGCFEDYLNANGKVPLPPYIKRQKGEAPVDDKQAYQTVYARHAGAVAAPTAGFHFDRKTLGTIRQKGIQIVEITLHVGYGTFSPVRATDIRKHKMHAEWFAIPRAAADAVNAAREQKRRVLAVGTTCVRALEFSSDDQGRVQARQGLCDLFIYPGYVFKVIDAMLTNFHLPQSTLLMLVSAFAGQRSIQKAYQTAIDHGYRFYSYGDAMLIG